MKFFAVVVAGSWNVFPFAFLLIVPCVLFIMHVVCGGLFPLPPSYLFIIKSSTIFQKRPWSHQNEFNIHSAPRRGIPPPSVTLLFILQCTTTNRICITCSLLCRYHHPLHCFVSHCIILVFLPSGAFLTY